MCSSRRRPSSMLTSTRPSTHRYQGAAGCGLPSGRIVAMADGLGSARKATRSGGRGGLGMAVRGSPLTVGLGHGRGPGANRGDVRPADEADHAVDALKLDPVWMAAADP